MHFLFDISSISFDLHHQLAVLSKNVRVVVLFLFFEFRGSRHSLGIPSYVKSPDPLPLHRKTKWRL